MESVPWTMQQKDYGSEMIKMIKINKIDIIVSSISLGL